MAGDPRPAAPRRTLTIDWAAAFDLVPWLAAARLWLTARIAWFWWGVDPASCPPGEWWVAVAGELARAVAWTTVLVAWGLHARAGRGRDRKRRLWALLVGATLAGVALQVLAAARWWVYQGGVRYPAAQAFGLAALVGPPLAVIWALSRIAPNGDAARPVGQAGPLARWVAIIVGTALVPRIGHVAATAFAGSRPNWWSEWLPPFPARWDLVGWCLALLLAVGVVVASRRPRAAAGFAALIPAVVAVISALWIARGFERGGVHGGVYLSIFGQDWPWAVACGWWAVTLWRSPE